jgi:hypothetical protein
MPGPARTSSASAACRPGAVRSPAIGVLPPGRHARPLPAAGGLARPARAGPPPVRRPRPGRPHRAGRGCQRPSHMTPRSRTVPDPDDPRTTRPETGSSGPHPVLEGIAEAAGVISDASAYLSPTREYDEPSLEKGDWPRDLDGPETLRMVGHLADIAYGASGCLAGITCQHAIQDAAKPELDVIADLLAEAGRKLSALTGNPGREAGATSPAQHATRTERELAAENFPRGPAASPQPRGGTGASPGRGPDSAVRRRLAQSPGTTGSTASTARQGRPRGHL